MSVQKISEQISANWVPTPKQEYYDSEEMIGERLFIYSQESDLVYQLNDGAAVVWLMCDGERDLEGIAREIGETYGMPAGEALHEVVSTVSEFNSLGLLVK